MFVIVTYDPEETDAPGDEFGVSIATVPGSVPIGRAIVVVKGPIIT